MKNTLVAGLLFCFAANAYAESESKVTFLKGHDRLPALVCGWATGSWFRLDDALELMKSKLGEVEQKFPHTHLVISSPTISYGGVSSIISTACVMVSES